MNRTRNRNTPDVMGNYHFRSTVNGVEKQNSYSDPILQYRHVDEIDDVVTPGYHKLQASGAVIMNPLSVRKVDVSEQTSSGILSFPAYRQVNFYEGLVTGSRLINYPMDNGAVSAFQHDVAQLINQLVADAKADAITRIDSTPYSFMEDLAELGSTMKTLGSPLSSAKTAAKHFYRKTEDRKGFYLKRKGLRRAEALARAAGDAWLSSRYEFRPIMYTIRDIYLGLPKIHTKPKRMKATSRKSLVKSIAGIANSSYQYIHYQYSLEREFDVKVVIYYTMSNHIDFRDWDLGLRLKDVPKTVWALMPYSWLVDRFIDVSSSIEALVNLTDPRLSILGACIVTTDKKTFQVMSIEEAGPNGSGVVYGGNRVKNEKYINRSLYSPSYTDAIQPFTVREALSNPSTLLDSVAVTLQRLTFGGRLASMTVG